MQPKVIRKLRPYYTYMHLCSATSKDRAFKKTGFDSTLISHETVRVLRLKHTEKDTHTKKISYGHRRAPWKVWFIKSSRWPFEEGTVRVRRCALLAFTTIWWSIFRSDSRWGGPGGPEGSDWFHLVSSHAFGFSSANWKHSHHFKHFYQFSIKSVSCTVQTSPALIHPCRDSSAQNEIHHHLRSRA